MLAVAAAVWLACESEVLRDPPRPSNVPADALWVGGLDGGVFVRVTKPAGAAAERYAAEIYGESGDVVYRGAMRMRPPGAAALEVSSREAYEGWDGEVLYLSGGRALVGDPPIR